MAMLGQGRVEGFIEVRCSVWLRSESPEPARQLRSRV